MRFRAVMMTSIAFILGLLPLVWAKGASEIARHDVSTPVFVGMIAASSIGVFLIPMLYVTWQRLREPSGEMFARKEKLQSNPAPSQAARARRDLGGGK
jgi:HAE1 family hydrophobic/amphiphilic exporter-1